LTVGLEVFPAAPKAILDAGWEGRPFDEKKLAIFNTGRAFFKGSSDFIALVAFNASACREVDLRRFGTGPVSSADERGRDANVGAAWFRFGHCCWNVFSGWQCEGSLGVLQNSSTRQFDTNTKNNKEGDENYNNSRDAGGSIRNGCALSLRSQNKFPALPVSGVKNPSPVAAMVGCFCCVSSGGARFIGGGRGGKRSSISGIDPVYVISYAFLNTPWITYLVHRAPRKLPIALGSEPGPGKSSVKLVPEDYPSTPSPQIDIATLLRQEMAVLAVN
jgi:hypothetical protein